MYREMRHKERAMKLEETKMLLRDSMVGRLAVSLEDNPYVVPLFYVYFEDKIYFHCAEVGQKMEFLSANPKVCFEVDEFLGIEMDYKSCNVSSKFRSAIAFGKAEIVKNAEEKRLALRRLVEKYISVPDATFDDARFEKTTIVAVHVEKLTGKKHD